jgi:hypothetical protein
MKRHVLGKTAPFHALFKKKKKEGEPKRGDRKRRELEEVLKEKKGRETERERPTVFFERERRDRKRERKKKLNREEKAGKNMREILQKKGGRLGKTEERKGSH